MSNQVHLEELSVLDIILSIQGSTFKLSSDSWQDVLSDNCFALSTSNISLFCFSSGYSSQHSLMRTHSQVEVGPGRYIYALRDLAGVSKGMLFNLTRRSQEETSMLLHLLSYECARAVQGPLIATKPTGCGEFVQHYLLEDKSSYVIWSN